jgi:hypothetical protein
MSKIIFFVCIAFLLLEITSSSLLSDLFSAFKPVNRQLRNATVKSSVQNNVILCDIARMAKGEQIQSKKHCHAPTYNFTFTVFFHNKDLLKLQNLKRLAQTFSQYSVCENKFMKYNFSTQKLEYFMPDDQYFWQDGKVLNETTSPEVYIIRDPANKDKRKIIFECKLPVSDVFSSLNYDLVNQFRPAHSYPMPNYRVTVSGLHMKLNFLRMDNLVININQKRLMKDNEDNMMNEASNQFLNNKKNIERYFVYVNSVCRTCSLNPTNFSSPVLSNSILCDIKVSCK